MALPTFLVIGSMKSGTTSLFHYLKLHPEIYMSQEKEVDFFFHPEKWKRGINWYEEQFDKNYSIRGEVSPNYTKQKNVPERIYRFLPNVKLIYLTRDPIERFVSHCNHIQTDPNIIVNSDFENHYIFRTSLYYTWFTEYLKYFPKEQILVRKSEDLRVNKVKILNEIFEFIGADPKKMNFESNKVKKEVHVTKDKLLESSLAVTINSYNIFKSVKSKLGKFIPFIKPIWRKVMYEKREIYELSIENEKKLRIAYEAEMRKIKEEFNLDYGY